LLQEQVQALNAQLQAAAADYEAAKAERGDTAVQWEQDREDLMEDIRWVAQQWFLFAVSLPFC
jgi:hypothetical protein